MNKLLYFIAGAAVVSAITWFAIKEYYEQQYNDDLTDYRKARSSERKETAEKESKEEYEKTVEKCNYRSYSGKEEPDTIPKKEGPYVISPEEFGDIADYTQISLTYYEDGVLTEDDFVVDNADELVGEFESHFGEYEDDSVFVRNDERRIDYEIIKVLKTYAEVLEEKPYLRNDG